MLVNDLLYRKERLEEKRAKNVKNIKRRKSRKIYIHKNYYTNKIR